MIIITIETAFKEIVIKRYKGYSLAIMLKLLHKEFLEKEHELVYLNNILNVILII